MSTPERLNPGLHGVHRIFCVLYAVVAIVLAAGVLFALVERGESADGAMGFLVAILVLIAGVGVAHGYAAQGARLGAARGRTLSRIFGVLWLFGFPLGTILGIYVLVKTSDKHWKSADAADRAGIL